MATNTTVTSAQSSTPAIALSAATVDTVTFSKGIGPIEAIEVESDGAAALWFTVDGSTPATSGNTTGYYMPASASVRTVQLPRERNATLTVKLISTGTPTYVVREGEKSV